MNTLTTHALDWITAREIDPEIAARLGWRSENGDRTIAFPYLIAGKEINAKRRDTGSKKFWQDPDKPRVWYNWDAIAHASEFDQTIVIVEGELDVGAVLTAAPAATVISVPDGAPSSELHEQSSKLEFVEDYPIPDKFTKVVIAVDGDGPGQVLANELVLRLGKPRCYFVEYPAATKDANDVLVRYGPDAVIDLIANARPFPIAGVYRASDLPVRQERVPHPTGIPGLDDHWKLRVGEVTVMTGIPSHGKTTFSLEVAARMADHYDWRCAIASFEMPPDEETIPSLERWRIGGDPLGFPEEHRRSVRAWVDDHFVFIIEDIAKEDRALSLAWLGEKIRTAVLRHGVKLVVVDPWNELDHAESRYRDETESEYIGRALRLLKRLAAELQIHLIIVAHPTKLGHDKGGEPIVPTLYDISGSANWANKADVGIVVHRADDMTEIRIRKVRFQRKVGKPGSAWLMFSPDRGRFEQGEDPAELRH